MEQCTRGAHPGFDSLVVQILPERLQSDCIPTAPQQDLTYRSSAGIPADLLAPACMCEVAGRRNVVSRHRYLSHAVTNSKQLYNY